MVRVVDENATSEPTALLRTPGSIAMALQVDRPTSARLLWPVRPGTVTDFDADAGTKVEVLPVRTKVHLERCRGCGRCIDACAFGALTLDENDPLATIRLESSICRGCNLCSSVCPTHTLTPNALSAEWWTSHLDSALGESLEKDANGGRDLILACQRRAGSLEHAIENHGAKVEVIRFRCVGQLDAGMLLEIYRRPVGRILVAGCLTERCRFNQGSGMAIGQIEKAKRLVDQLGLDSSKIIADWSPSRVEDPLIAAVARLVDEPGRKGRA